jgi:hypothetical protein
MDGSRRRSSYTQQVDAALDRIQRAREQVTARPPSAENSQRLAELADAEASWWETLSEHSRVRVHWRAALAARERAQRVARGWRRRAAWQRTSEPRPRPTAIGAAA